MSPGAPRHPQGKKRCGGAALLGLLIFLAAVPRALAMDPRDIVFECPCSAEWIASADGPGGKLELSFGVRSFRATESGEIYLDIRGLVNDRNRYYFGKSIVGRLSGNEFVGGLRQVGSHEAAQPSDNTVIAVSLRESTNTTTGDRIHEKLILWPVQSGGRAGATRYVDLLVDEDGDGVGDVNERIAGTNAADPASTPGESTVDILWLYDDGAPHGAPFAKAHHFKVVLNALHADNGTNIRLRTVGIRRIEKAGPIGWPDGKHLTQLMDSHGADITHQIGYALRPCGGCARVRRGDVGEWGYTESFTNEGSPVSVVAHELGHVMGLAHSAQQGEAWGPFRWSRGHHLKRYTREYRYPMGTIMSYGVSTGWVFSNPVADCYGEPCGVPATEAGGADARRSLDLLRFQVAAHRGAKPDTDGDGFVDDADAAPRDPAEWMDSDADGIGDNADPDDDGDGVDDITDRWPLDRLEWEDLDGDGLGDNADNAVEIGGALAPFRDAALRNAVERALGKSPGSSISASELAGLQRLSAQSLGIRDLSGLEHAAGLTFLELAGNALTDLSPLANLTNLEVLNLSINQIVDLSPLAGLRALEDLKVFHNEIVDLSPLSNLTNLTVLDLGSNQLDDLSPLARLTSLEILDAGGNFASDLSPLAGLTNLESLTLRGNQLVELLPLAGLTQLDYLDLSQNRIVDLSPLSGLTELERLWLSYNRISGVSSLSGLVDLQTLALEQNEISDASPLSGLRSLRELLLTVNRISDLSPLQGLANLETLGLGSNDFSDLSSLSGLTRLKDLRLDSNDITDLTPLSSLSALRRLWLGSNGVSDLSPIAGLALSDLDVGRTNVSLDDVVALPGFRNLRSLDIVGLAISDVRPLTALSGLERLTLAGNLVADISPLAVREIWSSNRSTLYLEGNPLDEASLRDSCAHHGILGRSGCSWRNTLRQFAGGQHAGCATVLPRGAGDGARRKVRRCQCPHHPHQGQGARIYVNSSRTTLAYRT